MRRVWLWNITDGTDSAFGHAREQEYGHDGIPCIYYMCVAKVHARASGGTKSLKLER